MSGRWTGRASVAALVAYVAIATTTAAPVSPGPLSRPHAALDDAKRCFDCHGRGEGRERTDLLCLECHLEIRERIRERAGFHGQSANEDCASCHPEHGGRSFDLIEWPGGSQDAFDHRRVGWTLSGRHSLLKCQDCHRPDKIANVPQTRDGPRDANRTLLGLDRTCTACHQDLHRGKLGTDCEGCHRGARWALVPNFDHARSGYPLTGKHATVDCKKCHVPVDPVPDDPAVAYRTPIRDAECASCHEDKHRGTFGTVCASCHVVEGFKIIAKDRFDHSRTGYRLDGKHATVACASCHDPVKAWGRKPVHARCGDCHRDRHDGAATLRGTAADCAACHDERGFRPATYAVLDHDGASYVLAGKHRTVECGACHRPASRPGRAWTLDPAGVTLRPASARCIDCHDDSHGGQLETAEGGAECSRCHVVDGWKPSTYDAVRHAASRLALDGRHASAKCAACHGADREKLPALAPDAFRGKARVAILLDPACRTCHADPHDGAFDVAVDARRDSTCRACHGTDAFRPARIDAAVHESFDYPLRGAHRAVPCVLCHKELGAPRPDPELPRVALRFEVKHDTCEACHANAHGTQFDDRAGGTACEQCHDVESFRPAARFDHTRDSSFALGGAHAAVPCGSCHRLAVDPDGVERTRFRPLARACRECHASDGRDLGTVDGGRPR